MPLPQSFIDNQNANSGGIAPVASDADTAYAAAQYVDQNHPNSEGPQLKPKQFGSNCVPTPSGFKVLGDPVYSALGFVYKLVWNDIPDGYSTHVREYRVYAQSPFDNNPAPTSVGSSSGSPCTVRVVSSGAGIITFWLQPVLGNGMFLPLENCPTCTSTAPNPYYQFDVPSGLSGGDVTILINNNLSFGGSTDAAGIEVYFTTTGLGEEHTTIIPGEIELTQSSTTFISQWSFQQLAFSDSTSNFNGGITTINLATAASGADAWGKLVLQHNVLFGGPLIRLDADSASAGPHIDLYDGTSSQVTFTSGHATSALGSYVGYIVVYINNSPFQIPYYA